MKYTPEQQLAIDMDNTNIVVSAGAGSGKTAVLTERVIRKLKDGIQVNKLLILTFTNEAASEMKNRIRDSIIKNKLDKQLDLLSSAYITTFDSFALSLVKKYNYILNVSDNLKIIDSNIITIYKYKLLDQIFENKYGDLLFNKLVDDFCLKDDKVIKDYVIMLSNKLDILVNKEEYLKNYFTNFYSDQKILELLDKYNILIRNKINELEDLYRDFLNYIDDGLINKLDNYFRPLFNGREYSDYLLFMTMSPVRFTNVSEDGLKLKDEIKKKIDEIKTLLRFNSLDEVKDSIKMTKDYVIVLLEIINELDMRVWEYKHKYDIYEFNDIAHLALLLVKNNLDIREEIKTSFNEIMVDEYQDTSSIQEEFISYIANNNVYMVGDIKQSIYRFRNANPYIFHDKYELYGKHNGGEKIDLISNFRSRKETLDNINEIFNVIMDDTIGNANYLKEHNMVYGNKAYDNEDTHQNNKLEIYNYEFDKDDTYTREEKELFIVAEDILNKIKNNYQVLDKKTNKLRSIQYSDICIITDRNKYLELYRKILEYHEIPTVIYMDEGLNQDVLLMVIKNLINLVWNVKNKIYDDKFRYIFTSVARSFLFEYDDNLIYHINKENKYFEDNITKMCMDIDINKPICNIINDIIDKFKVYDKLIKLSDIDKNIVKIDNLIDIANNVSDLEYTLIDFINYLDDTISQNLAIKYATNKSSGNAVKIMNIHKSKGLEFNLCYFTGMHNKFTIKDISAKTLFDEKYGLILPYKKDNELMDTIIKDIYVNDYFYEEISEKIRLFYVELTRCREKMIIVTNLDDNEYGYDKLVPDRVRIKYRSFLDILNSVKAIRKYIINKEANYTHLYNRIKLKNLNEIENDKLISLKELDIQYDTVTNKHFSKDEMKLYSPDTVKAMEYGTKMHEIFEYDDFKNPKSKEVVNFLKHIDNKFINVYHEHEFSYILDNVKYCGIIDLVIEYEDVIYIIDYKLKNIDDNAYIKQLVGYKKYIKTITDKQIKTFLYSIKDDILTEVKDEK